MKQEKKTDRVDLPLDIQSLNVQPTTAEEMVNKYGTYEIQPTSDSGNAGLPRALQAKKKQDDE